MYNKIIKRKEVYYCNLGNGVGSEQEGIRPVLIISNDIGNKFSTTAIIVPLTSTLNKCKHNLPVHVEIDLKQRCTQEYLQNHKTKAQLLTNSIILTEQIRAIDKKRLLEKIAVLTDNDMEKVTKALSIGIALK